MDLIVHANLERAMYAKIHVRTSWFRRYNRGRHRPPHLVGFARHREFRKDARR